MNSKRVGLLFAVVALALGAVVDGHAFFQKTKLEGALGRDVSGVWLAVHHLMPTFRVRLDRDPANVAPFRVGPVPKELAPAVGAKLKGVVIKEFTAPGVGDKYGLFEGDVITKVNTMPVTDEESFAKALAEVKEWFLVTVHRTALKHSKVRIVKIKYEAGEQKTEGASEIASEKVEVRIADGQLPFADDLEKSRIEGTFFIPTKAQVEGLEKSWYKLPAPQKPVYVNGEHRVVGAAAYDSSLREDDNLDGTLFAIVTMLQGNPMAGGGGQNIVIYGFEEIDADSASGSFVDSTIATAPFPISIEFYGRFEMTKLAPYSDEDEKHQAIAAKEAARKEQEAENKNLELAPDVPADIPPPPKDQPAVAE